jgi:hypothetical protein
MLTQERARRERLQEEAEQLTFRPAVNAYSGTRRPLLKLADPGPYLAYERKLALQRQQRAAQLALQQQVAAFSPCCG